MTTLTNRHGDKVEVKLGGFNGDNVQGGVEDSQGTPINNAKVTVTNIDNGEQGTETTGNDAEYDIDVNASAGDKVYVHVEWQDEEGHWHVVSGVVTLQASSAADVEIDISLLERLDKKAMKIALAQKDKGLAADRAYHAADAALISQINALGAATDEQQKDAVDQMMTYELLLLLEKIRSGRGKPRNADDVWSAIEEMLRMLVKLYFKAMLLQGREMPRLPDPRPMPQPDLT